MNPSFYELALDEQDPVTERLIDLAIDQLTGTDLGDEQPAIDDDTADALGLTHDAVDEAIAVHLETVLRRMAEVLAADVLARVHNELNQLPVVHATSRWQRVLGRLGIATRAWCGERIVVSPVSGPSRECRECRRALDGER